MQTTTVSLLTHTAYPLESCYLTWLQSRSDEPLPSTRSVRDRMDREPAFRQEVTRLFHQFLDADMPITETLYFTFLLEGVSIALREQLVRHRIGHRFGPQTGVDEIPDLPHSTFWSQTSRFRLMDDFATKGHYVTPESCQDIVERDYLEESPLAIEVYRVAMHHAEQHYRKLCSLGVPPEEARLVLPMAATHRMTWTVNLQSLCKLLRKRSCWIAQLGLWEPVVRGIVTELCEHVDEVFRTLIDPPCISKGVYTQCKYPYENENRTDGTDPEPPCKLWCNQEGPGDYSRFLGGPGVKDDAHSLQRKQARYHQLGARYADLWRRDPATGVPLQEVASERIQP